MIQERINFLKDALNKYSYNYYVLDNPLISDFEYDELFTELKTLEENTDKVVEEIQESEIEEKKEEKPKEEQVSLNDFFDEFKI